MSCGIVHSSIMFVESVSSWKKCLYSAMKYLDSRPTVFGWKVEFSCTEVVEHGPKDFRVTVKEVLLCVSAIVSLKEGVVGQRALRQLPQR